MLSQDLFPHIILFLFTYVPKVPYLTNSSNYLGRAPRSVRSPHRRHSDPRILRSQDPLANLARGLGTVFRNRTQIWQLQGRPPSLKKHKEFEHSCTRRQNAGLGADELFQVQYQSSRPCTLYSSTMHVGPAILLIAHAASHEAELYLRASSASMTTSLSILCL